MVTLDQMKAYLRKTDVLYDDVLSGLISRAIYTVQHELDWYFDLPRDTTEVLNGNGGRLMYLRQPPVTKITVSTRVGPTDAWEVVDPSEYEVDGREIAHASYWVRGLRNYRFEYDEGFTTPPGDVVQLVMDLVAAKWGRENRAGVQSETLGRYSYTLKDVQESASWGSIRNKWKRGRI